MTRLRGSWPYAVAVAAPLILFAPFLLGLRVLYWGTIEFQFYPWQHFALEALRAGHLPLWDPLLGNGAPLLANYQSAVLYPPNWLALLLPLALAQAWLAALHLAWAGAGMVALARLLRLPPLAQAVAGLSFGLCQYLVSRVSFLSINATVAWLPWVLCLLEYQLQLGRRGAGRRQRATAAAGLAACAALQLLAGHAQTTWYTLLLAGAWCAWRLLSAGDQTFPSRLVTATWLIVPLALGGMLSAVQLLPTAELLQQSPRATAADYNFVMTYSYWPWRLLTLVAPDLVGNPARGQYFGYGNYWEDADYAGLLPLLLALGVIAGTLIEAVRRIRGKGRGATADLTPPAPLPLRGRGEKTRSAVGGGAVESTTMWPPGLPYFLIGLAAVALIWGLGQNTPVFPFLYWHVPSFNLFQAPTRILVWLEFALALLAGLGAARWRAPRGWALYWTRLGAAGAVAMALVGLAAWIGVSAATQIGLQIQTMGRALALAGFFAFVAALLSLTRPEAASPTQPASEALHHRLNLWTALVILFVIVDLLLADFGLNPGALPDLYQTPAATAAAIRPVLQGHRLLYFPNDEYALRYGTFVSFKSFGPPALAFGARESLLSDLSALDDLETANNFEPLVSARYAGMMDVISSTHSLPLLRLMDVAVIASPQAMDLERIATSATAGVSFYRVPGVPQRVWIVSAAQTVAGGPAALNAVADPGFDPTRTVILEADDEHAAAISLAGQPSPAALTLPVTMPQDGWMVIAQTSYPGWVATVDDQPATVRHADYAFEAVAVPAGSHTVVLDYQPASLRTGWFISVPGAMLLLGMLALSRLGTKHKK